MYNQVTDRYRFVEVEVIEAPPVLGRLISAKEDHSKEIFKSKEYVRSLRPRNPGSKPASSTGTNSASRQPQIRVHNGDAVYQIDLRPRSIRVVNSFKTKDNFVRVYDFTLVLKVNDPVKFAKGYSVGQDPVFLAIDAVQKALKKFGEEHEHDKLTILSEPALDWNKGLADDTGVMIQKITNWILHEDPKRLETAEIEQDALKESLKERFKREREALDHMYKLHDDLSNTAAKELRAILQERIRDTFESGQPISKVAEETLDLLNALFKGIEEFRFSNGTSGASNGASSGGNHASMDSQGTSSGGSGTGADKTFEMDDTMKDSAIRLMPALSELMREEP